jgi:membrane associated rhomboid family serine protease
MGLENRDYIRDAPPPSGYGYGPHGYWAVKYLLIANIAVFVLQLTGGDPRVSRVTHWLELRLEQNVTTSVAVDAPFYEVELEDGRVPKKVIVPGTNTDADGTVPAGTTVEPVGVVRSYSLVEWQGKYGLVRSEALSQAVTWSYWQLPWRLLTSGFCHGGLMHIAFNMFVLWMFGRLIEPIYGSLEFLLFFLAGVVVSGLAHVGYILAMGVNVPAVGASGGVMAVVFLTAMIYPREKVYFLGIIPMEMRVMAVVVAIIDVAGGFYPAFGIAHWAHLGGAAFGVAYYYYHWRLSGFWFGMKRKLARMKPRRPRPKVRVYEPEEPESRTSDVEAEVDRLLEKISQHGEGSLTDKERTFLSDASRKYRKR